MRNAETQAGELLEGAENVRRLRDMFVQSPNFSALLQGSEHRFVLTNPAYERLIGHPYHHRTTEPSSSGRSQP